jgi:hypothetical protein
MTTLLRPTPAATCAVIALALLLGSTPAAATPQHTGAAVEAVKVVAGPLAEATPGTVTDLSLGTSAVAVDGVAVASVPVRFTLTGAPVDAAAIMLLRTTPAWDRSAPGRLVAAVTRVDGTEGNGTFRGTLLVPSSAHGTWRATVVWFDTSAGVASFTPGIDLTEHEVTLQVTGTHRPRFRLESSVPAYPSTTVTLRGTLTDSTTGRPLKGRTVAFGVDDTCAESGSTASRTTDATGRASWSLKMNGLWALCAWAPLPGTSNYPVDYARPSYGVSGVRAMFGVRLTSSVTAASVRAGRSTTVTGSVLAPFGTRSRAGATGTDVRLQRLVGRTWRTVNSARVRSSARYTLTATPPARGRHAYRVWYPTQSGFAGTVGRTLWITVR